jgi:hypothetical protein
LNQKAPRSHAALRPTKPSPCSLQKYAHNLLRNYRQCTSRAWN